VLLFGTLLIVALTAAAALMLWRSREDSLATWRLYMQNFSATAAEHAAQTLKTADYALGSIVDLVQSQGVNSEAALRELARSRATFEFIHERVAELPLLDVATLVALDGEVLAFSRSFPPPAINLADRDYHLAHLADSELLLFVSAPVKNRGTGRWTFYLARKIRAPSGQPIGLALAGIQSSYFERFYRSINLSETDTAILLLRSDGTLLARHPPRPEALGLSYRDTPSMHALAEAVAQGRNAALVSTSVPRVSDPSDAEPRMSASHVVDGFPLAVTAITREKLMLGHWRQTAWLGGAALLLLDGAIAAATLYIHWLLRRRRAELQQLDAAHAATEAAAAMRSRFLANLSHEVRLPLQGMLGLARRLLEAPLQPAQRQQAQIIERSGRLLLGVIDEVLDISQAGGGRLELEPVSLDLRRLARDCIALFEPQARLKGLVLHLELDADVQHTQVLGDPLRLSQVLNNLLSNALKFTAVGSVTLRIVQGAPGRWVFSVRDTGVGLTAQQRAQLIEPGSRAQSDATLRTEGPSLGLATVQRLVHLLGGQLDARGTPGQGSEFWCELPLPHVTVATPAKSTAPATVA
jgi:signal transduction histidine kinase